MRTVLVSIALVLGLVSVGIAQEREIIREGKGDLEFRQSLFDQYDLSDPKIDFEQTMAPGVPRDGIPALTDPERTGVAGAEWAAGDRMVEVVIGGEAVAYPIKVLNFHEIANDTVGGTPIAVTYCPLCDSAAVMERTLGEGDAARVLEFGVSGLLYNSNVVMYERGSMGLWSQVFMRAISGPDSGRALAHLPVRVVSFELFKAAHPEGEVLTSNTGHERDYAQNPYERYFGNPNMIFHQFEFDDRVPSKELGVGISDGESAWFVSASAAGQGPVTVNTKLGDVLVEADASGIQVAGAPEGVSTIQTFYHSWSAFYPKTQIVHW